MFWLWFFAFPSLYFAHAAQSDAACETEKVASAWFAGWHADEGFDVNDIPWLKYTEVTFAFAETTPDVNIVSFNGSGSQDLLLRFVAAAHQNGVNAKVSVGGWTGSLYWSSNVAEENRTAWVKTLTDMVDVYDLDGLDFDWEYPGTQGIGCNTISANDTQNFLAFLKELREHPIGANLTLSAAVYINPFTDQDGVPSTNVTAFADYLDYVAIMNYDIWGPWSATVGPNAPLNDSCAHPEHQMGSAVSAVSAWTAAGFPSNQLLLGVAAYGHSFSVTKVDAFSESSDTLALYAPVNSSVHPVGDSWDDTEAGVDVCGNVTTISGVVDFWGLIEQGYLTENGDVVDGVPYVFDNCSQTPFIYNTTTEVMISYDNAESFAAKGQFIADMDLAGFAMWEAGGDYHNILLDSIRGQIFA
ncbi:glycoside hydrolase family 18 protein [Armillaria gallica]|uniref:Glycoside hydrolase family 18 protein n=1 Tax=Armillaria gallica TaxID=47427 RepID=A0A2H3DR38_ARMGA|nr:glycoside hydrolase family 18 protein [Armillaria gallica]